MEPSTPPRARRSRAVRAAGLALKALLHATGVAVVALLGAALFVDGQLLELVAAAPHRDALLERLAGPAALHLGLSALVWCAGAAAVHAARQKRARRRVRALRTARGTVMTEFLILLVPFLLLTSGLAQFAIINIGKILANVASYQAARTVWVWQPEVDGGRRGASNTDIEQRARIAAAMVMAPVAPGGYGVTTSDPDKLERIRGAMYAHWGYAFFGDGSSKRSIATAQKSTAGTSSRHRDMGFMRALDSDSFGTRAARKLTYSYHATDFTRIDSGDEVGARIRYDMQVVFPWFAYIWGTQKTVAGRSGYFTEYNREFTLRRQVELSN